jgi:osmotically-inducible protein OsmY
MYLNAPAAALEPRLCAVTEQARARLKQCAYASVRRVSCAFDAGVLVLQGQLRTFFHKQLAQEAVADLEGVHQVRNEIEVVPSAD